MPDEVTQEYIIETETSPTQSEYHKEFTTEFVNETEIDSSPIESERKQPGTDAFYSVQEADSITESNLESTLLDATIVTSRKENNEEEVKLYISVAIEKCRNFLPKYEESVKEYDKNLFTDMDSILSGILGGWEIEVIISMFLRMKDRVISVLAEKIGFRKSLKSINDWQTKLMIHQQVPESEDLHTLLYKDTNNINKIAGFINYTISPEVKYDQQIVVTGERGNGKSSTAIELAILIAQARGEKFDLTNRKGVYYIDIKGLRERLLSTRRQIIVLDEGIFSLSNLDTLTRESKDITSTIVATRNRGHVLIMSFTSIKKAVKSIIELSTMWIHKPHRESGLLLAKSKIYVGKSPWQLKELDEADSIMSQSIRLTGNRNFIVEFATKRLPLKIETIYEENKLRAQEELGEQIRAANQEKDTKSSVTDKLLKDFEAGKFTKTTIKRYLADDLHVPLNLIDKYANWFTRALANTGVMNG